MCRCAERRKIIRDVVTGLAKRDTDACRQGLRRFGETIKLDLADLLKQQRNEGVKRG